MLLFYYPQLKIKVVNGSLPAVPAARVQWPRGPIVYITKRRPPTTRCDGNWANIRIEDELLHFYPLVQGEKMETLLTFLH